MSKKNTPVKNQKKKIDPSIIQAFQEMADKWPSSVFARDRSNDFSGGLMSPGYLANLDSRGEGPPEKIRVGRKVAYPVKSFIQWLMDRAEPIEPRIL